MSTQKGSMSSGSTRKRMKPEVQEKIGDEAESQIVLVQEEGFETNQIGSEEMELNISLVLEKIENFTQRVSELLESGKTMFKDLCNEFEEKLIMIHKEQVEKWQEEIKELRALDASNEEANGLLQNARYVLQLSRND
ncbi:knotted 1-binding protein [Trifolium repens]|nr:knotted 1-binding protein [Trifolium repens]KAK2430607.1 knotted 1-binding protein [Trifolium repens]